MPLIPALGKQKQADLCEFKTSLVYKENSRTASAVTQKNAVSKKQKQTKPTSEKEELNYNLLTVKIQLSPKSLMILFQENYLR